jgi:hypothetical protein
VRSSSSRDDALGASGPGNLSTLSTRSFLGLCLLAACVEVEVGGAKGKIEGAPAPAPAPAPAAAPAPVPEAKAAPAGVPGSFDLREPVAPVPSSIELVDAGAEPRAAIAIATKKGERAVLRLGLALDVAMRVGENDVPKAKLPRLEVDLATEVGEREGEGTPIALRVVEVRVDESEVASERVKAAMQKTIDGLRKSTGKLVLASDGRVLSIELVTGVDAIENRSGGLDHALVELLPTWPKEPVGVGARWKVVQSVVRGGVTLQRASEVRLVGRSADAIELEVEATHVAVEGADASGSSTRIEAQSGDSRGRIVVAPNAALPTRAEITAHTTTRAAFGSAAKGVLVAIDLTTSLAR